MKTNPTQPLVAALTSYRAAREVLYRHGGGPAEVRAVTAALTAPIVLTDRYGGQQQVKLIEPQRLNRVLRMGGYGDTSLVLDVRTLPESRLPAHSLVGLHDPWNAAHTLVLREYTTDPRYDFGSDPRLHRVQLRGQEQLPARVSQWRVGVAHHLKLRRERDKDIALRVVGAIAARSWYETQHVGLAVARGFGMAPEVAEAIEMLYLVLGSDLHYVRGLVGRYPWLPTVFDRVLERPFAGQLLSALGRLHGPASHVLRRAAAALYKELAASLAALLVAPVHWGIRATRTPAHEIIYANLGRLDLVADELLEQPIVSQARDTASATGQHVAAQLLDLADAASRHSAAGSAGTAGTALVPPAGA